MYKRQRIASARPDIGTGYELQAITIAVLGGISIQGGEGTVGGVPVSYTHLDVYKRQGYLFSMSPPGE